MGRLSLFQGIFPTQGSNPACLQCRRILYHLSHQGSPKIPEWVAHPFSRELCDPGIELGSPALQVDSLPAEPPPAEPPGNITLYVCITLFTCPFIGVHLGCFYLLAIVNSAAMNMMLTYLFETLFSVPLAIYSKVGFLYDIIVLFLIFLNNLRTHFHSGYTILHSHQQCFNVIALLCQHLLFFYYFLIVAILMGRK